MYIYMYMQWLLSSILYMFILLYVYTSYVYNAGVSHTKPQS